MKGKIKGTGEIIEILGISKEYGTVSYIDYLNNLRQENFRDGAIEIIDDIESDRELINWEQRRYELSKEAMGAFIASPSYQFCVNNNYYEAHIATAEYIAKDAVNYADALIAELRKPNPDDEFSSIVEQAPNLFKALKEIAETDTNLDILGWSGKIKTIARDAINRCKKGGKE